MKNKRTLYLVIIALAISFFLTTKYTVKALSFLQTDASYFTANLTFAVINITSITVIIFAFKEKLNLLSNSVLSYLYVFVLIIVGLLIDITAFGLYEWGLSFSNYENLISLSFLVLDLILVASFLRKKNLKVNSLKSEI